MWLLLQRLGRCGAPYPVAKHRCRPRNWVNRLAAVAAGATLIQAGSCAIDTELLLTQVADLMLQALLGSLTV